MVQYTELLQFEITSIINNKRTFFSLQTNIYVTYNYDYFTSSDNKDFPIYKKK